MTSYVSSADSITEVLDVDANRRAISFVIVGQPKAKDRHRWNGRWNCFYNPSHRAEQKFKKATKELLKKLGGPRSGKVLFDKKTPLAVSIKFMVKRPKSHFTKKKGTMSSQPKSGAPLVPPGDIDNYGKFVFDCLNRVVFHDDKQIVKASLQKMYDPDNEGKTTICISHDGLSI